MIKIEYLVVGPLQVNCFIVYDEESLQAVVIDPGDDEDRIMKIIEQKKMLVEYIICTHGHFDHIGAVSAVKKRTGAEVLLHKDELRVFERAADHAALWGFSIPVLPKPDRLFSEGDSIQAGNISFSVMHTPGHSPGSICLLQGCELFSGDTIFAGSIGRTDFPGGSLQDMKDSFRRIINLSGEIRIYPGHGPFSTVLQERASNFFVHEL